MSVEVTPGGNKVASESDRGSAWLVVVAVFFIHVIYDGVNYSCGVFLQGE